MKLFVKIFVTALILPLSQITYAADISVDDISVVDANTLSVTLSENPNLEVGEVNGEFTILNDVSVRGAIVSGDSATVVELMLEDPIMPNTNYSLLTISGTDGSIDFTTPAEVEGHIANNTNLGSSQDIESVEIVDDRTLLLSYVEEIDSQSFEYKLLAENTVVSVEKPDHFIAELIITVEPPFVSEKDYILMFIEIQDASGDSLEFDTGIYDFTTEIIEENTQEEAGNTEEDITDGELDEEEISLDPESDTPALDSEDVNSEEDITPLDENLDTDLNAAGNENDVETVAQNATETPDAGAELWLIILATLVINSFYYLSRRKKLALS